MTAKKPARTIPKVQWVRNLTPHDIHLKDEGRQEVIIPRSGEVCRVESKHTLIGHAAGFPVYLVEYDDIKGLPERDGRYLYVVSQIVLQALKQKVIERDDVVAPDTTPEGAVRDESGKIVAVRGLQVM